MAGMPVLEGDLNSFPVTDYNRPVDRAAYSSKLETIENTVYFSARSAEHGSELWRTDGTTNGERLVAEIAPGELGSDPESFTRVGNLLYFTADDGTTGRQLWRSNGTATGTIRLTSKSELPAVFDNLVASDDRLYFVRNNAELWTSDGTAAGTVRIRESQFGSPQIGQIVVGPSGSLYFTFTDGFDGGQLFRTDGTSAGTVRLAEGLGIGDLAMVEGTLYFHGVRQSEIHYTNASPSDSGSELWKSDGTREGTKLVKDIAPGVESSYPVSFFLLEGKTYFLVRYGSAAGLWTTDGTASGTVLMARFPAELQLPTIVSAKFGKLFLSTYDDGLWSWNPDNSEFRLIYDNNNSGPIIPLLISESGIYFNGYRPETGIEPWRIGPDGSAAPIGDFALDGRNSSPQYFAVDASGRLFTIAGDGKTGIHLWRSRGNGADAVTIAPVDVATQNSNPQSFVELNGSLYFIAVDGSRIIRRDGATGAVTTIGPPINDPMLTITSPLYVLNDSILFEGRYSRLWKITETSNEFVLVTHHNVDEIHGVVDGELIYYTFDQVPGLWATDGTSEGTRSLGLNVRSQYSIALGSGLIYSDRADETSYGLVKRLDLKTGESTTLAVTYDYVYEYQRFGNLVYFISGHALWRTDGMPAGTVRVREGYSDYTRPDLLEVVGDTLFFRVWETSESTSLWKTNAVTGVTERLAAIAKSRGTLETVVYRDAMYALSQFDGETTLQKVDDHGIAKVQTIGPRDSTAKIAAFAVLKNEMVFLLEKTDTATTEVWTSDGTKLGTRRIDVAEFVQAGRRRDHDDSETIVVGERLYFAATTPLEGRELWSIAAEPVGNEAKFDYGDRAVGVGSHRAVGPKLGTRRDAEKGAAVDDFLTGTYDDDGVSSSRGEIGDRNNAPVFIPGSTVSLTVNVTNVPAGGSARVKGWIDFNGDDRFDAATETVLDRTFAANGKVVFPVVMTSKQRADFEGAAAARFRIVDARETLVDPYVTGSASGEIEDYRIGVRAASAMSLQAVTIDGRGQLRLLDKTGTYRDDLTLEANSAGDIVIVDNSPDPMHALHVNGLTGVIGSGTKRLVLPKSLIGSTGKLNILTGGGDDVVRLDTRGSSGDVVPANGLLIDLGAQSRADVLQLEENKTDNDWNFTSASGDTLRLGKFGFVELRNLESAGGGQARDVFHLSPSTPTGLRLNGGGGTEDRLEMQSEGSFTLVRSALRVASLGKSRSFGVARIEHAHLIGGAGNDAFRAADFTGRVTLEGRDGDDLLIGTGSIDYGSWTGGNNDTLLGGAGDDVLHGLAGVNVLDGGVGDDVYRYGEGLVGTRDRIVETWNSGDHDRLDFSAIRFHTSIIADLAAGKVEAVQPNGATHHTIIDGMANVEDIVGSAGNDVLIGNGKSNHLIGGGADDILEGSGGNDLLQGGLGNDTYRFRRAVGSEVDTVNEGTNGGSDDVLDFSFLAANDPVAVRLNDDDAIGRHVGRRVKTAGVKHAANFENAVGGAGNDRLTGNDGRNVLAGGAGSDSLFGALGNDVLIPGAGDDLLVGGTGDDDYYFEPAATSELDEVREWTNGGRDRLDFRAFDSSAVIQIDFENDDAMVVHERRRVKAGGGSHANAIEEAIGNWAADRN